MNETSNRNCESMRAQRLTLGGQIRIVLFCLTILTTKLLQYIFLLTYASVLCFCKSFQVRVMMKELETKIGFWRDEWTCAQRFLLQEVLTKIKNKTKNVFTNQNR